ncbi:MAG: hypothetical protein KME52_11990 [Desmonostoc geniculatum HA4340-LM1]|nr:hypothetical protein [Desmonostoc geniculatum HA4340-LM1]
MTQTETKKRYTLREVQALASNTYGLLVQPLTRSTYGIFFEGQLVAEVKKLVDAIAIFPDLYRAIQEQLAEQATAIAPVMEEAIALSPSSPHSPLPTPHSPFSHHAYEDLTNWELRQELNNRGYQDAIAHCPPAHNASPYMAGYNRGVRDRRPPLRA